VDAVAVDGGTIQPAQSDDQLGPIGVVVPLVLPGRKRSLTQKTHDGLWGSPGTSRSAPARSGSAPGNYRRATIFKMSRRSSSAEHRSQDRPRSFLAFMKDHGAWIVGIPALILTGAFGVANLRSDAGPSSPQEHIAECRQKHNAPSRTRAELRANGTSADEAWLHTACTWPPVPGGADDGYYEIRIDGFWLDNVSMADEFTRIDVFKGPCSRYHVRYHLFSQGLSEPKEPLKLDSGQFVSMYDGKAQNFGLYEEILPDDFLDGLSVLAHSKLYVDQAWCESV